MKVVPLRFLSRSGRDRLWDSSPYRRAETLSQAKGASLDPNQDQLNRQLLGGQLAHAAERSLELANRRYQEGYADFQRVLDAQRSLFSQAERELVNRGNHVAAVIDLYRAMGGGWLDMPVEEVVPAATRDTMRERSDWGDLLDAPLPEMSDNAVQGTGTAP